MSPTVTSLPNVAGTPPPQIDEDRVAMSKEALKHAFLDNLFYIQGKFPALATKTRLLHGARLRGARPHAAALDQHRGRVHEAGLAHRRVSLGRIPAWARISATTSSTSASTTKCAHGGGRARPRSRRAAGARGRAGPGQRRPRPARGLLHRLAGHARDAGAGLRHPLRVRHLPAGDRRRLAGREDRQVAALRQPVGDRAARVVLRCEVRRPHRSAAYDEYGRKRVRWVPGRSRQRHSVRHADPRLPRQHRRTRCGCGRPRRRSPSTSRAFNRGDYYGAVNQKVASENLTKVLYPNDEQARGKELRLEQQYFFVSCSLQDMLRICTVQKIPPERFHEKFAVQLNDTHPSIAVAELMRLLVDEHGHGLGARLGHHAPDLARTPITRCCPRRSSAGRCAHVRPAAAAPSWRSSTRSTRASSTKCAWRFFGDEQRIARLSLIDESGERYVRMAHLAQRRQPRDQRRRGAALRAAQERRAAATSRSCGRRSSPTRPTA